MNTKFSLIKSRDKIIVIFSESEKVVRNNGWDIEDIGVVRKVKAENVKNISTGSDFLTVEGDIFVGDQKFENSMLIIDFNKLNDTPVIVDTFN